MATLSLPDLLKIIGGSGLASAVLTQGIAAWREERAQNRLRDIEKANRLVPDYEEMFKLMTQAQLQIQLLIGVLREAPGTPQRDESEIDERFATVEATTNDVGNKTACMPMEMHIANRANMTHTASMLFRIRQSLAIYRNAQLPLEHKNAVEVLTHQSIYSLQGEMINELERLRHKILLPRTRQLARNVTTYVLRPFRHTPALPDNVVSANDGVEETDGTA